MMRSGEDKPKTISAEVVAERMSAKKICRIVSGILVILVGLAVGFGGLQLSAGAASSWPDLIASVSTIKNVAFGLLILAVLLAIAGSAVTLNLRWGQLASAIGI